MNENKRQKLLELDSEIRNLEAGQILADADSERSRLLAVLEYKRKVRQKLILEYYTYQIEKGRVKNGKSRQAEAG